MNYIKLLLSVLAIAFGIFLVIYGGYDDSPGAQGLGLLIITSAVFYILINRKKNIWF